MTIALATVPCPDGLACTELTCCQTCNAFICGDHTGDVITCATGGLHCDEDCRDTCTPCTSDRRHDHERGDD